MCINTGQTKTRINYAPVLQLRFQKYGLQNCEDKKSPQTQVSKLCVGLYKLKVSGVFVYVSCKQSFSLLSSPRHARYQACQLPDYSPQPQQPPTHVSVGLPGV